ncbi:MAG: glutathione S-transferase [Ectothiorhodospiraceae bacterium]|nr:glutathione S-transferase [Ectothiorhodospiraceae bacterium]
MPLSKKAISPKTVLPILYSFRRCPYAMRARMAVKYSGVAVDMREVLLSNKPASMLTYSPKGTVPVLVLPDNTVIDESRDIIDWALSVNDPMDWLPAENMRALGRQLIDENDSRFKEALDKYKYHVRFPEHSAEDYRAQGEVFLSTLNGRLSEARYLLGDKLSVVDIAVFPFIRQFAHVDKTWFEQAPYFRLQDWLEGLLQSDLFSSIMHKQAPWKDV